MERGVDATSAFWTVYLSLTAGGRAVPGCGQEAAGFAHGEELANPRRRQVFSHRSTE